MRALPPLLLTIPLFCACASQDKVVPSTALIRPTPPAVIEDEPEDVAEVPADDPYAAAEAEAAVQEGWCFLASPGIQAQTAAFDGGVGVVITSEHVDRLRADARVFAENNTTIEPLRDPRLPVADVPVEEDEIAVTIGVQDAPGGVLLLLVPDDPDRVGELTRRISHDLATLNERCDVSVR